MRGLNYSKRAFPLSFVGTVLFKARSEETATSGAFEFDPVPQ